MDTFIEYQRFPDYEAASELIDILEENEIPYQVNDSAIRFDIAASSISPFDKQVIIQIRENDFERVYTLFKTLTDESQNNSAEDHYLYSFSDTDIIDVIANPSEWNEHEVVLAKQISNSRGLKPTAELIKTIRKEKLKEQQQKETETKNIKKFGYGWFLWIAILSVINTIDFAINKKIVFIFGLGLTQVVDGIISVLKGDYLYIGFVVNLIISGVFVLFWYYAKKEKTWAFLTGIIIYGLDTIIFVVARDWWSVGFHLFALTGIIYGFTTLRENLKTKTIA